MNTVSLYFENDFLHASLEHSADNFLNITSLLILLITSALSYALNQFLKVLYLTDIVYYCLTFI